MAKTNRRTKPVTDARLTNTVSASTPTPPQPHTHKRKKQQPLQGSPAATAASAPTSHAPPHQRHTPPRPGSKQALIVSLLARQQGASLTEMMEATGWLPHTSRAALTGLRQRGCTIERSASANGSSTYRITNPTSAAAKGVKA